MVASQHIRIQPAISPLELLESNKEPLFEVNHALVEVCHLHLHLILRYPLLVRGQADTKDMYLCHIEFYLPFLNLNVVLVSNGEFDVQGVLVGLFDLLL